MFLWTCDLRLWIVFRLLWYVDRVGGRKFLKVMDFVDKPNVYKGLAISVLEQYPFLPDLLLYLPLYF